MPHRAAGPNAIAGGPGGALLECWIIHNSSFIHNSQFIIYHFSFSLQNLNKMKNDE
jgi:hypothetical protein